jgi:hypothetical protein
MTLEYLEKNDLTFIFETNIYISLGETLMYANQLGVYAYLGKSS